MMTNSNKINSEVSLPFFVNSFSRLKVTTDKAGVGPSQVTSGKISLQLPTGQFIQPGNSPGALRKTLE